MAQTIFGAETPTNLDNNDGDPYSLGTKFEPQVDGQATHGRWYFSTTPATAPIQIAVYRDSDQVQLGAAVFPGGMPPGWAQVEFDPPIDLEALEQYRVVVWTPNRYVSTSEYFASPKVSGDIICPAIAGRFSVGPAMVFPDSNFLNGNYWPDVVFQAAGGVVPAEGQADLGLNLAVAAAGARASQSSAELGLGLAVAAAGAARAEGTVALSLDLSVASAGARASGGSAALGLDLAPAATGARAALGSAALGLGLAVSASGSNGDTGRPVTPFPFTPRAVSGYPWTPRPVKSFQEVES